jgi:3-methyladenine DNA glycosylase/8-oxoguanine DNA glycosylase
MLPITPTEFKTTLLSHGWFDLAPFKVDIKIPTLMRAFKSRYGDAIIKIIVKNEKVLCETLYGNEEIAHQMTTNCLSLDIDINQLHSLVARHSNYDWIIEKGFGRYLRSPTLYEDCIRIISTANQNWSNTKKIIQALIENYGYDVNGFKDFPEPNRLIRLSESGIKEKTKCGYRASSFLDIADRSLSEPDFFAGDGWKGLHAKDFYDRLSSIRGMGPASASYLCRIYGKPYLYSVDRWVTKRCDELWGLNFRKTDKKGKVKPDLAKYENFAKKRYERFGDYGPSVFWFEISKYWHDNKSFENSWWS